MPTIRPALAYFATVFAVGAFLGPIREFLLLPVLGPTLAVAAEAPVMLAASFLAARWTMRRWPGVSAPRLGACALGFLLAAEVAGSLWLRGMTMPQYAAHLGTPPGLLSLALFATFGLMPLAVSRIRVEAPATE